MIKKIIQNFKAEINGVKFTDDDLYYSVGTVLADIEHKFGEVYNKKFIRDISKVFRKLDLKYPEYPFQDLEQDIYCAIQKAEKFEEIKFNYLGDTGYFSKLNKELLDKKYTII